MARKTKEDSDRETVNAVNKMVDGSNAQTLIIKEEWRDNYDMFVNGTQNDEKEEWQTDFSNNKLQTSIRTAQGRLVNTLVNTPDWYELCPSGYDNKQAALLAPAFKKMVDYYLDSSKFKRHAGTFFLCSLISQGALFVGWKQRLLQNPEFILSETEEQRKAEAKRIGKNVANPMNESELSGADMENALSASIDEFTREAQGLPIEKKKPAEFVQIGCLDFKDINHEKLYWDVNAMYMEDSKWKAFDYTTNRWELEEDAKLGYISQAAVDKIGTTSDTDARQASYKARYNKTVTAPGARSDLVEVRIYTGPLVVGGKIKHNRYFCVIANKSIVLKEGVYPFWEPPGHLTPIVACAVRQIPYRATGAGIGSSAVKLQRVYDSNWQLICDTYRFNIGGINVVNYHDLVDKGQLEEGIYPGMTLRVRKNPDEVFKHIDLKMNETGNHPVQQMLEQAIDALTGINELMVGGSNPYSRTSAAETNSRIDAGNQNVNIIALDLEQNFLIPTLEKVFARVLQYGMNELQTNPELAALFSEDEMYNLQQVDMAGRMQVMSMWYNFKIKGFSANADANAQLMRMNELLQIVSNPGNPLSQLINLPVFMKEYFKVLQIKDADRMLIQTENPLMIVTSENTLLLTGHQVMPSPNDDHEFHLQQQGPLAQSPYATPEVQQHVEMHTMMLQQMQMQQQAEAEGQGQQPQGPVQ